MDKSKYTWVVIYVSNKTYNLIKPELIKQGYTDVKVFIPTLSLLIKKSKGKEVYEDSPLLFNYGFLKIPTVKALDRNYLLNMRKKIPHIVSFLKRPDPLHNKRIKKRVDSSDFDDFSIVATCSKEEILHLKKISRENKVFSNHEITNLKLGDYITLKGYPFEGTPAIVKDINLSRKEVTLNIFPDCSTIEVKVGFETAIYSVYRDSNPDILTCNQREDKTNTITEESVDRIYEYR